MKSRWIIRETPLSTWHYNPARIQPGFISFYIIIEVFVNAGMLTDCSVCKVFALISSYTYFLLSVGIKDYVEI